MNYELSFLHDMCQNYTILYAEDDEQTQEGMATILKRIFKTVHLASNGEVALSLFQKHKPHLVITDIQMPKLNGLDLSKAIKELSPQTPIIITTAFNEERYFITAIENGIDSFLFKPIDKQKLFQTLIKTIAHLDHETKAKELDALKKMEEINQASEESIQTLSNLFPSPALFYKDNQLIFVNTQAKKTFEAIELETISQETLFVSRFNIKKDKRQKIKFPTSSGLNRIYYVYSNALFVGADLELVQAYIFMDITITEYQKIRLNAHDMPLRKQPSKIISETSDALPQSLSASDFIKTLSVDALYNVNGLVELQDFVVNFVYDYQANPQESLRAKITELYLCYAKTMQNLHAFDEQGRLLHDTARCIMTLHLEAQETQELASVLLHLSQCLFAWYETLFVSKSAKDIHHLDEAITASCLQIKRLGLCKT